MKKIIYGLSGFLLAIFVVSHFSIPVFATELDSGNYQWDDYLKNVLGDSVDSIADDFPLFDAAKNLTEHQFDKIKGDAVESLSADEAFSEWLHGDTYEESITNIAAEKISSEAIKKIIYLETGLDPKDKNPLKVVSNATDIYIAWDDIESIAHSDAADKSVQMFLAIQNMEIATLDSYITTAELGQKTPVGFKKKLINFFKIGKWKALKGGLEVAQGFEETVLKTEEYQQMVSDYVESGGKHFGWHFIGVGLAEAAPHIVTWPFELYDNLRADGIIEGNKFFDWVTKWVVSPYKPSSGVSVYKPNIYLYADQEMEVTVTFDEPNRLMTTIPSYRDIWRVAVKEDESGELLCQNESYGYLFYESIANIDLFEKNGAFLISIENRSEVLKEILEKYGFNEQEIADFVAFWDDFLDKDVIYLMYPQTNEIVDIQMPVTLNPIPEHFYRIWFGFKPYTGEQFEEPADLLPIIREGFYGVEWGGFFFESNR